MKERIEDFEIMAPVGSRESLAAAIKAGAGSVYFGIGQLNMRSHSANHFTIADITATATQIFGELFSEKMFRSQLCYFDDIDYTEAVDWLIANPPTDDVIRQALTEIAVQGLEEVQI
jgi:hypothetical protein